MSTNKEDSKELLASMEEAESEMPSEIGEQQKIIDFSKRVLFALDGKVQTHIENHTSNCTSLSQLKRVFYSGAEKHPKEYDEPVNVYAMARVNMFLRTKATLNFKELIESGIERITKEEDSLEELSFASEEEIQAYTFVDISEDWIPNDEDFSLAKKDVKENDLNYSFSNINELYIDFEEKSLGIEVDYL